MAVVVIRMFQILMSGEVTGVPEPDEGTPYCKQLKQKYEGFAVEGLLQAMPRWTLREVLPRPLRFKT
jgi:hypothetical protein